MTRTRCGAVLGAALWVAALGLTSALRAAPPAAPATAASTAAPATVSPATVSPPPSAPAGVTNVQLAWQNWTLNCQGCHRLDGSGSDGTAPSLAGTVAKFLWVPGGREYLIRVPGVATSPLSDADLAEVMNWMLWRYDREHLPSNFRPFTAAEMSSLRSRPLRLEAAGMRSDLLAKAEASGPP
jgi:mono/diheme cytochrome c family protein